MVILSVGDQSWEVGNRQYISATVDVTAGQGMSALLETSGEGDAGVQITNGGVFRAGAWDLVVSSGVSCSLRSKAAISSLQDVRCQALCEL